MARQLSVERRLDQRTQHETVLGSEEMQCGAHHHDARDPPVEHELRQLVGLELVDPGPQPEIRVQRQLRLHPDQMPDGVERGCRGPAEQQLTLERRPIEGPSVEYVGRHDEWLVLVVRLLDVRIVSLLPSATEILFALGLGDQVVGVTFECDFPAEARTRRVVSTTALPTGLTPVQIDALVRERIAGGEDLYHLDRNALRDLDPDLVVTQDLCAVCAVDVSEVDEALDYLGCRASIVTLDPMTLDEVLASIEQVGEATDTVDRARPLVSRLRARIDEVTDAVGDRDQPRLGLLEWTDPPFSSGHWVPDMVAAAGAVSALGTSGKRSERIDWDTLRDANADAIVVAPCGYHLDGARLLAEALVEARVLSTDIPVWAVDADAEFVRPGPRLVEGIETLAAIAHPDAFTFGNERALRVRS